MPAWRRAFCSRFEARSLLWRRGNGYRRVRFETALDVEPSEKGGKVERRTSPRLPRGLRRLTADGFDKVREGHARLVGNPTGG